MSVQCLAALSRDSSKPPSVVSSKPTSRASSKPASKEPSRAPSVKSVEIVAEEDVVAPGKITINVFRAKKLEKKVRPQVTNLFISLGNVWEGGSLCEGNLGQPSRPVTDDQQQPGEPALTSFHFHCKCINSSES